MRTRNHDDHMMATAPSPNALQRASASDFPDLRPPHRLISIATPAVQMNYAKFALRCRLDYFKKVGWSIPNRGRE
jgi:hypothetical protein